MSQTRVRTITITTERGGAVVGYYDALQEILSALVMGGDSDVDLFLRYEVNWVVPHTDIHPDNLPGLSDSEPSGYAVFKPPTAALDG